MLKRTSSLLARRLTTPSFLSVSDVYRQVQVDAVGEQGVPETQKDFQNMPLHARQEKHEQEVLDYQTGISQELVSDLSPQQIQSLLKVDQNEAALLLKEQNSLATQDNLYLQDWQDDLKTIYQAGSVQDLDTPLNVTAAIFLCSFNLLGWKLFQGEMSYTFMAALSGASLVSVGHLRGLFALQEELAKQVVHLQVSKEGDRVMVTLNDQ